MAGAGNGSARRPHAALREAAAAARVAAPLNAAVEFG